MAEEKIEFEKSLKRLEEIVAKVEGETLPLEESLKLYEEGKKLIFQYQRRLCFYLWLQPEFLLVICFSKQLENPRDLCQRPPSCCIFNNEKCWQNAK